MPKARSISWQFENPAKTGSAIEVLVYFQSMDIFESERVRGERVQFEDFEKLHLFHQDPKVMETLGGLRTEDETKQWLQGHLDHWKKYNFGAWLLYDKKTNECIGRSGLHHVEIDGRDEIELGYAFSSEYWGKGLATEISLAVLDIAKKLGISGVVAFTHPTNVASRRVMEKTGFVFERDFDWKGEPCVLYRKK